MDAYSYMSSLSFPWDPYYDRVCFDPIMGCYVGFPMWRPMYPQYQHPPPTPVDDFQEPCYQQQEEVVDVNQDEESGYPDEDFSDEFQGLLRFIDEVRQSATSDDASNYEAGLKIVENYGLDYALMFAFA